MSHSEKVKKIIIEKCKYDIEEINEITSSDLNDHVILNEIWEILKDNSENFNNIVKFIIQNINEYNEEISDNFIFISKINKSTLNVNAIPFYDENSKTCLLFCNQENEEIIDVNFKILYKIILDNFDSIFSLDNDSLGIFQIKHVNELCLEDRDSYSKVLLTNIGLAVKDDILLTRNKFLKSKELTCNKNYLQYKDSIEILSEYNNTTDILWKFLLLYQILENFSYRKSIAQNLRNTTSLNIKHLSNIYTSPKGEGAFIAGSIQDFIKNINNSLFFEHRKDATTVKIELTTFGNTKKIKLDNIDIAVKNIATFLHIKLQEIDNKFILTAELSKMIYTIRNCIVHNKETEWIHINNSLLKEKIEMKDFFEDFLLPTMEFIVKELIFMENDITDYPNDKKNYILIWGEDPSTPVATSFSNEVVSNQNNNSIMSTFCLLGSQVKQRVYSILKR